MPPSRFFVEQMFSFGFRQSNPTYLALCSDKQCQSEFKTPGYQRAQIGPMVTRDERVANVFEIRFAPMDAPIVVRGLAIFDASGNRLWSFDGYDEITVNVGAELFFEPGDIAVFSSYLEGNP